MSSNAANTDVSARVAPGLAETAAPTSSGSTPEMPRGGVQGEAEERGRLKRRRQSSLSPRRASSPSRGHDRTSGSRYREHHRKHHRPSSPSSSISPPTAAQKKTRRRSDAEPDHTLRGRARNRSRSQGRTRSPMVEGADDDPEAARSFRKRRRPPSRHTIEEEGESAQLRRQRSYHKQCSGAQRDSEGPVVDYGKPQGGAARAEQVV
ncbi:hypothetical protein BDU57DRAFT_522265 [Ampelomyces quisqualis]|uniref:Uncharacterized protein n=1 Tax=Ampelomyces quisqualis TaxID=50730 RepID=A0A6A5QF22_AMPQU|nr:hypothetical protein BDU57DRAFT_522265 [Ampelomyces quisqualis]